MRRTRVRSRLRGPVSAALAVLAALAAPATGAEPLVCAGGPGEGQTAVSVEAPGPAPGANWWMAVAEPAAPRYRYMVLGICGDTVAMPEPCPVEMVFDAAGYRGVAVAASAQAATATAERNCAWAMEKDYGGLRHEFDVAPSCTVRQVARCREDAGGG